MVQFELQDLGYEFNTLEPHFDAQTMQIHHTKHHHAYLNKFNASIEGHDFENKTAEEIVADWDNAPEEIKTSVRNNGGGYINHNLFFKILKKDVVFEGEIADAIIKTFATLENFKNEFSNAAATQFGSGWAWLIVDDGKLKITSSSNQDTPLSEGKTPILCLDVWEHSYYLKFQNKRPEYIESFFNIINWKKVNQLYLETKGE